MTKDKLLDVFKILETKLLEHAKTTKLSLVPTRFDASDGKDLSMMLSMEKQLNHLLFMSQAAVDLVKANRTEKAMRWLGWLQASMWYLNIYTLEDMKNLNRTEESTYSSERL